MLIARTAPAASQDAPASPLGETVRACIGENVYSCYQCVKCTSGCPLADQFDLTPNQVMRSLQLGDTRVLSSKAIWLCASCHTCATRCPRGIDVTAVMDVLRCEARARGVPPAIPEIPAFNALFMRLVGLLGRMPELLLLGLFNLVRGKPLENAGLGWQLFRRGRLKLMPGFVRAPKKVATLAAPDTKIGYFPGCASEGSAIEYARTARLAAEALGLALVEPEGWTCCGSSPAHATGAAKAPTMPMQTLPRSSAWGLRA